MCPGTGLHMVTLLCACCLSHTFLNISPFSRPFLASVVIHQKSDERKARLVNIESRASCSPSCGLWWCRCFDSFLMKAEALKIWRTSDVGYTLAMQRCRRDVANVVWLSNKATEKLWIIMRQLLKSFSKVSRNPKMNNEHSSGVQRKWIMNEIERQWHLE